MLNTRTICWAPIALGLLLLSTSGCERTVTKLAKGKGLLAQDAKAVLAALAKRPGGEKILVVDKRGAAYAATDRHGVGVVVGEGRIVEVMARGFPVDFLALSRLAELRYLDVSRLTVARVALAKLPKLQVLELRKNKLTALKLEDLPLLRKLVLVDTPLEELHAVRVGLTALDLRGARLKRIVAKELPKLRTVTIEHSPLSALTLVDLPSLAVVHAAHNRLTQLTLAKLPALTHLELAHNRLKVLPQLAGAGKLQRVTLDWNALTSLAGLEVLAPKELFVNSNALTSLTWPAPSTGRGSVATPMTRLITLSAVHNKLTSLAGLERLPKLQLVYLDFNPLTSLAGIEALKQLKKLHVSHNKLTSLAPLAVGQLEELIATDNAIAAAPELFGPASKTRPKLAHYDLRRNALAGVGAALLFAGVASVGAPGLYPAPPAPSRRSLTTGYDGATRVGSGGRGIRSTGSRYSSSGGYRSGK